MGDEVKLWPPSRCDKDCRCRDYIEQLTDPEGPWGYLTDEELHNKLSAVLLYVSTCRLKRNRLYAAEMILIEKQCWIAKLAREYPLIVQTDEKEARQ